MKIRILLIFNLVFLSFVHAETIYKTLDAEGNVIFSDVPSEGAEKIEFEDIEANRIPEVKASDLRPTIKLVPEEIEYTRLEIISPKNDTTILNNEGNVSIKVEVVPALVEESLLILFLDGKEVDSGKSLEFSLSNLDRGTHTIYAIVKNAEGKVLKRSTALLFHLRRASKLFKKRENEGSNDDNNTGVVTESSPSPDASVPLIPGIPSL